MDKRSIVASIWVVIFVTILCFSIYGATNPANPSNFDPTIYKNAGAQEKETQSGPPQEDIIVYFLSQSAIVVYLNVTELTQLAETIVIGNVTEILPSQIDPETGIIYTDVVLDVETYLKIPLNQSTILVRTLGGTVGNLGMGVEDQVGFTEGERVLLFMGRTELYGNALHVVGGIQGKYTLQNGMAINRDPSRNTTLEELLEEIEEAIQINNPADKMEIANSTDQMEFQTISKGCYSGHKSSAYYVIQNGDEWADVWNQYHSIFVPQPPPPKVNFSETTIIAVFMGEHTTGGHGIEIKEILDMNQSVVVKVEKIHPGKRCVVTLAFTSPYHIVKIAKMDKEITFETVERTIECPHTYAIETSIVEINSNPSAWVNRTVVVEGKLKGPSVYTPEAHPPWNYELFGPNETIETIGKPETVIIGLLWNGVDHYAFENTRVVGVVREGHWRYLCGHHPVCYYIETQEIDRL